MHSSTITAGLVAAIAALPAVHGHGYLANAIVGGKTVVVGSPNWVYSSTKPTQPGWFAYDQDNGFVSPSEYGTNNITCHKGATPGTSSISVAAGSTIGLQWNTWPDSHHGPVINQLAAVSGSFSSVDSSKLQWFAAQNTGLIDGSSPPGKWATDTLIANSFTSNFKVPANLAPGNYVLRHEIIGLHSAGNQNGAQNYPQCVNLVVTGSGTAKPASSGADTRVGTKLYSANDAGILINIYQTLSSYSIPGPAVWSGLKKREAFQA